VTIDFGRRDFAERLAIDSNGRIVVAGFTEAIDPNRDFALARLLPNGDLDPTFDGDGRVITPFGSGRDDCQAVALETNGKIVIAGISFSGASLDFALARYNLDGSLDTTFDDDGKLTTTISSGDDYATGVAVDGGGRIVVGGISQFGPSSDFVVARYFDRDRPPISISDAPAVVEGDAGSAASAVFTVTLSAASTQTITVHYATADGTAIAGKDYNATSGDLSFAPGETSKQIVVAIRGERLDEGDESFFVKLSNPTNAAIVRGTGVGTIQDDDTSLFVITHGLQPDRKYPFWVTDMAAAINGRLGYGFAIDEIANARIEYDDPIGPPSNSAGNFILFDWSFVSWKYSVADDDLVAGSLARQTKDRLTLLGGNKTVDVHLIGHSRGGYVVHETARRLKGLQADVMIDYLQVTTLDPRSWGWDGKLEGNPGGIADYTENFVQRKTFPNGQLIQGAVNVDLTRSLDVWDGRGLLLGREHAEVHDWYHWSIDTDDSAMTPVYSDADLVRQQQRFFDERFAPATRQLIFGNPNSLDLDKNGATDLWNFGNSVGFFWSINGGGAQPAISPGIRSIEPVAPNPRTTSLNEIRVTFTNQMKTGWARPGALQLTRDGVNVPIYGLLSLVGGSTYRLWFGTATLKKGLYILTVNASGFSDLAGNVGDGSSRTVSWVKN
jgi:uncharacterized delta-60 repeat protein